MINEMNFEAHANRMSQDERKNRLAALERRRKNGDFKTWKPEEARQIKRAMRRNK